MTDTAPVVLTGRHLPARPDPPAVRSALEVEMAVAKELAKSDIVPTAYQGKPANVLVAIGLGRTLGLEPAQALYGMHVIEGTPSPSAKLQAALVRRAGHKLRILETTNEKAVVQIVRSDDPDFPVTVEFTAADARAAGWLDIWAERWVQGNNGRRRPERWVFPPGLGFDATVEELKAAGAPDWALSAQRKRRDPWHLQRSTMLHHRAVTTCVGRACPEVVSGLDFEVQPWDEDGGRAPADPVQVIASTPDPEEPASAEPEPAPEPEGDISPRDERTDETPPAADPETGEILDAELVDDAEPEQLPDATVTVEQLKAAAKEAGVTQAEVIREATERHGDTLPNLTAIVDHADLAADILDWLRASSEMG